MEIWLWSTQMALNVPAASREWPSSTLIATRQRVRQIFYPISSLSGAIEWLNWEPHYDARRLPFDCKSLIEILNHLSAFYMTSQPKINPPVQPTAGEGLRFLLGRRTARITLTGRLHSPVSKRRKICCVESETKTNTTTFHLSHVSLVSLLAVRFSSDTKEFPLLQETHCCSAICSLIAGN